MITFESGELRQALKDVAPAVGKGKCGLPILKMVRIQADAVGAKITANYLDGCIVRKIGYWQFFAEKLDICLDFKVLQSLVSGDGITKIEFLQQETDKLNAIIQVTDNSIPVTVPSDDPSNFPEWCDVPRELKAYDVTPATIDSIIEMFDFTDVEINRMATNCVFTEDGGGIAATDGHWLYLKENVNLPDGIMFKRYTKGLFKSLHGCKDLKLRFQDNEEGNIFGRRCEIANNTISVKIKLPDGKHPNVRMVIPIRTATRQTLLSEAKKAVALVVKTAQKDKMPYFVIHNEKASIRSSDGVFTEIKGGVSCLRDAYFGFTFFNCDRIDSILKAGFMNIELASPNEPAIFRKGDGIVVLMPCREA